jgi:hypothetical protein
LHNVPILPCFEDATRCRLPSTSFGSPFCFFVDFPDGLLSSSESSMKSSLTVFVDGFRGGMVAKSQGEEICKQTMHKSANASVAKSRIVLLTYCSAYPTVFETFTTHLLKVAKSSSIHRIESPRKCSQNPVSLLADTAPRSFSLKRAAVHMCNRLLHVWRKCWKPLVTRDHR